MNKVLMAVLLCCMAVSVQGFTAGIHYKIRGTVTSVTTGKAILKRPGKSDTLTIINGRFEGGGTVEKAAPALLEIQSSAGLPVQVILEAGTISITEKNGNYTVGGSPNNEKLQQIRNQLMPYADRVKVLREESYQKRGAEQKVLLKQIEEVQQQRTKKAAELVKANENIAGFITLLSFYRKETAGNIARYLTLFSSFSDDPGYQQLGDFYKSMNKAEVGLAAPLFTLPDLNGKMVSLTDFRNKYVLVDFWYHNCGFCRKMAPGLRHIYSDLKQKDFEIVSISVDGKSYEKEWREAIAEDGATWTELWDYDQTLPAQYGVEGYPTLFLLDRDGKIVQKIVGYTSEDAFRKILSTYGL
jgi:peroxiredoxin